MAEHYVTELPSSLLLEVVVPDGWVVDQRSSEQTVQLLVYPHNYADFPIVQLTATVLAPGQPGKSPDEIRAAVEQHGVRWLRTSLQKALVVAPVPLRSGAVFFYHVTDREPERGPRDYRELRQGFGEIAGHRLSFMIMSRENENAYVAEAMRVVASTTISQAQ